MFEPHSAGPKLRIIPLGQLIRLVSGLFTKYDSNYAFSQSKFSFDSRNSSVFFRVLKVELIFIYPTKSDQERRADYDKRIGLTRRKPLGHEVDIEDFETDSEDDSLLSYRCRCNGKYYLERDDFDDNVALEVQCSDCSLFIQTSTSYMR